MWNEPSKKKLEKIPRLYETEETPLQEKKIYLHFFLGSCDWYICEFDGEDTFWGFAHLGDDICAEWGYVSFKELRDLNISGIDVDRDLHWNQCNAIDVEKIRRVHGWTVHPVQQCTPLLLPWHDRLADDC